MRRAERVARVQGGVEQTDDGAAEAAGPSVSEPLPRDPPPPPGWEDPLEGSPLLAELTSPAPSGRQRSPQASRSPRPQSKRPLR